MKGRDGDIFLVICNDGVICLRVLLLVLIVDSLGLIGGNLDCLEFGFVGCS